MQYSQCSLLFELCPIQYERSKLEEEEEEEEGHRETAVADRVIKGSERTGLGHTLCSNRIEYNTGGRKIGGT